MPTALTAALSVFRIPNQYRPASTPSPAYALRSNVVAFQISLGRMSSSGAGIARSFVMWLTEHIAELGSSGDRLMHSWLPAHSWLVTVATVVVPVVEHRIANQ